MSASRGLKANELGSLGSLQRNLRWVQPNAHSWSMKSKLQQNRKAIDDRTLCAICLEIMDAASEELEFCQTCGQSNHDKCIKRWLENHDGCPACRNIFTLRLDMRTLQEPEFDTDAFNVYFQWLYTDKLTLNTDPDRDPKEPLSQLASADTLGEKVQDKRFCQAVACKFLSVWFDADDSVDLRSMFGSIYNNTAVGCRLRNCIIDVTCLINDARIFNGDMPYEFLREYAKRMCQERPKSWAEVREMYFGDFKPEDLE
ncbi:hypothetical protein BDV96DRAFT_594052 [Lophiotrema nucula]|uniref:RING-type domain-containing protein n=1 Tax=Lophiotrema nucula TaxID=690887 RepID=A0A6A5ZS95_9PLEO|nr:hypothetical protein BDV96DRAFT_594052 [Lophiotrema nucula]